MLLAPAPAGGLTTSGKPTSCAKSLADAADSARRCLAHGTPAARRTVFIWALSRKFRAENRVHAGDAQVLADLRDRHLELLEDGHQPLHVAELPAQSLDRPRDLPGVERVVDLPVPGQAVPEPGREAVVGLAGDQGEPDVGQARGRLDEPRRRVEQIGRDKPGDHHGKNVLVAPRGPVGPGLPFQA